MISSSLGTPKVFLCCPSFCFSRFFLLLPAHAPLWGRYSLFLFPFFLPFCFLPSSLAITYINARACLFVAYFSKKIQKTFLSAQNRISHDHRLSAKHRFIGSTYNSPLVKIFIISLCGNRAANIFLYHDFHPILFRGRNREPKFFI